MAAVKDETIEVEGYVNPSTEEATVTEAAHVEGDTIVIDGATDGTVTLKGDGIRVENGNLVIDNPNYEVKEGTLIVYKNRKK